jgi:hypothetical protein
MGPKEVIQDWVDALNRADVDALADFYNEMNSNDEELKKSDEARHALKEFFTGTSAAEGKWIIEDIKEDGEWVILEWRDPSGMRGCGFFRIVNGKIVFQRCYCDKT